jgi:hypothetical protein
MLQRLSVHMAPITTRAAEYGPAVPACCNACRTCTTTNIVGLMLGAVTVAGIAVGSFAKRIARGPGEGRAI